jgi:MSHA biogenesis protein MshI
MAHFESEPKHWSMDVLAFLRKPLRGRRRRDKFAVLTLKPEGIGLAAVRRAHGQLEAIEAAGFHVCREGEREKLLAGLVARFDLAGADCRIVLNAMDFRMVQVSAPEVPDAEMRDALRWKVQEFIDFPASDGEVEFFPMPSPRQMGMQEAVTVVVCRSALIRSLSALCESAGLRVDVIDIPELALRNLACRLPESERGVAVLYLETGRSKLQIQRGETIYISRELEFSLAEFDHTTGFALPSGDRLDRLALEIQRSLDYYESFFGNPPVAGIVITPVAGPIQRLADALNHSLGVLTRVMDIGSLVPMAGRMDDGLQQHCIGLIGAALRPGAEG